MRVMDLVCIGVLIGSLFLLTPLIDNYQYDFLLGKGIFEKDMLFKVMGEARDIFSDYAYIRADEYFHGGLTLEQRGKAGETEHIMQHLLESEAREHEHAPGEGLHKKDSGVTETRAWNILPYIGERAHISEHVHIHGDEEKEMLPWFYYAVRLNPNNVLAYTIGGHTLGIHMDRPDEALAFLKEGSRNNPDAWQIYEDMGEIYFLRKKDYENALANFLKAESLVTDENAARIEKGDLYSFIAGCYEQLGQIDKAIGYLNKKQVIFPDNRQIRDKIEFLRQKKDQA